MIFTIPDYEDKKREEMKKNAENNSEEFPNANRTKVMAGFVTVISMFIYALSTGLIKVIYLDFVDQ